MLYHLWRLHLVQCTIESQLLNRNGDFAFGIRYPGSCMKNEPNWLMKNTVWNCRVCCTISFLGHNLSFWYQVDLQQQQHQPKLGTLTEQVKLWRKGFSPFKCSRFRLNLINVSDKLYSKHYKANKKKKDRSAALSAC